MEQQALPLQNIHWRPEYRKEVKIIKITDAASVTRAISAQETTHWLRILAPMTSTNTLTLTLPSANTCNQAEFEMEILPHSGAGLTTGTGTTTISVAAGDILTGTITNIATVNGATTWTTNGSTTTTSVGLRGGIRTGTMLFFKSTGGMWIVSGNYFSPAAPPSGSNSALWA